MTITNSSGSPINIGSMVIGARDPSGRNVDFGIVNDVTIPANGTYDYSSTRKFTSAGNYSLFIANWNNVWSTSYPKSYDGSVVRSMTVNVKDNPLITTGIQLSPANPNIGDNVTATMTITNSSGSPINIGSMVIGARDPSGRNVDFGIVNDVTIPANGTYDYSSTRKFTSAGNYSLFIANWNNVWSTSYPKSYDGSVVRSMTVNVN